MLIFGKGIIIMKVVIAMTEPLSSLIILFPVFICYDVGQYCIVYRVNHLQAIEIEITIAMTHITLMCLLLFHSLTHHCPLLCSIQHYK